MIIKCFNMNMIYLIKEAGSLYIAPGCKVEEEESRKH